MGDGVLALLREGTGMRLLVFGKSGQVATELARRLPGEVTARFLGLSLIHISEPTRPY